MRLHRFKWLITCCVAAGLCGGCARATEADRAMVRRYHALRAEAAPAAWMEVGLWMSSAKSQRRLRMLAGEEKGTRKDLASARRFLRDRLVEAQAAALWQPAPTLNLPKRRGPVTIDGLLDEAAWAQALEVTCVYPSRHDAAIDPPRGRAKLLWDNERLYAAYTVIDAEVLAPAMQRDEPVWQHDCVELFICPQPATNVYWEINISPVEGVYDSFCRKYTDTRSSDMSPAHNLPSLTVARQRTADGYTVEMSVTFADLPPLGGPIAAGTSLPLRVVTADKDAGDARPTYYGHVRAPSGFHDPWTFGAFVLSDD